MKIITRYLFREILNTFRLFLAIFAVVLFVNVIYDELGDLLKYTPPISSIVLLMVYSLPELIAQTFPLICLLSTIFAYGLLAKNKEILALVASGVSFWRLAVPSLVFGVALTGFMFWFNESVVPAASYRVNYIKNVVIKGKRESFMTRKGDQMVKGKGNRFYYMEGYDSAHREMLYPTVLDLNADGSGVAMRIDADRALLTPAENNTYWASLEGAERWTFKPDGTLDKYEKINSTLRFKMEEENLDLFLSRAKRPSEMNYLELRQYIAMRAEMGDDVAGMRTPLQLKLSFPLSCLLMALLGFCVVADVHARHFARGVTMGLIIAIGFYLLNTFCAKLGEKGSAPPLLAGWLAMGIFFMVVLVLFNRLKKIRR